MQFSFLLRRRLLSFEVAAKPVLLRPSVQVLSWRFTVAVRDRHGNRSG